MKMNQIYICNLICLWAKS